MHEDDDFVSDSALSSEQRVLQLATSYKDRADSAFETGDLALAIDLYKRAIADIGPYLASPSLSKQAAPSDTVDLYTKCRLNAVAVLFHRREWMACAQEGRNAEKDELCRYSTYQRARLVYYMCVGMMKSSDIGSLSSCRMQFQILRDILASPHAKSEFSAQEVHEFEQIGPALLNLELSTLKKFVSRCKQLFTTADAGTAIPVSSGSSSSSSSSSSSNPPQQPTRRAASPELVQVLLEASGAFSACLPYLPPPYPAVLEACQAHLHCLAKHYDKACALYFKLAADASLSRCYRDSLLLVAALASQYCNNADTRRKGLRALRDLTVPTASDEIGGKAGASSGASAEAEKKRQVHQRYILDAIQAYASVTYGIMKLETAPSGGEAAGSKVSLDSFLDALSALSSYFESSRNVSFWQTCHLAERFRWDLVFGAPVEDACPMPEFDEFCKLSGYFSVLPDGLSVFAAAVAGITRAVGSISDTSKTVSTSAHVSKLISDVLKRFNFKATINQIELQSRWSHIGCFGSSSPVLDTLSSISAVMKFLFDYKKSLGVMGYNNTMERLRDMGALVKVVNKRLASLSNTSIALCGDPDIVSVRTKCSRLCNRLLDLQFEFCTWLLGCMNVKPFVVCDAPATQDVCVLDKHSAISFDLPTDAQIILLDCLSILGSIEKNASSLYSSCRDLYFSSQSSDRIYALKDEVMRSFDTDPLKRGLHGIISTSCLRFLSIRIQALYYSSLASWRVKNKDSGKLEVVMTYLEKSIDAHREYDAIVECIGSSRLVPKSELRRDSKGYELVVSDIYFHLAKTYELTRRLESADEAVESCLRHLSYTTDNAQASTDLDRIRRRQAWMLKAMLCRGDRSIADECIRKVRSLCMPPSEDPDDHERRLQSHLNSRYPGLYVEVARPPKSPGAGPSPASLPAAKPKPNAEVAAPTVPRAEGFSLGSVLRRVRRACEDCYSDADKDLLFACGVLTTAFAMLAYFVITVYFVKREY